MVSVSRSEMERDGLKVSRPPDNGTYEWTNPQTGEVIDVPEGIDPGWAYNPGKTAWGQRLSREVMASWRKQGAAAYDRLIPENWENYGLPERVPVDRAKAKVDYGIEQTREGMEAFLREELGGAEKAFSFIDRDFPGFRHDVLVNAEALAEHLPADRAPFLPLLREVIEDPYEIWLSFERHKGTGRVFLRQRFIKAVRTGKDRGMIFVAQARNGMMEAWTVVPTSEIDYLNNQRFGRLLWKRD
jgi:hypothetical protein